MATERLSPSSLDVQTNLSGTVSAIQDDPDSPDGNWLTAISTSANCVCRVSFPTPSGNLTTGAGLQEFRVLYRNNPTGRTADNLSIFLYENGSVVGSALLSQTDPSDSTVYSGTWNAADLSNIDGSLVECHITIAADTSPTPQIASGDIGAIEWNVEYDVAATNYERTLTSNVDANDPQTRGVERTRSLLNAFLSIMDGDLTRNLTANYIAANNVSAFDSIVRALETSSQTYERILASGVDADDSITRDLFSFYLRLLNDGIDVNDSIISSVATFYIVTLTSSIMVTDGDIEKITDMVREIAQSVDVNDSVIRIFLRTYARLLQSNVSINDSLISAIAGTYLRLLQSNVDISDSIVSSVVALFVRTLQSGVDLSDSLQREIAAGVVSRVLQSALSVSDGDLERYLNANYTVSDKADVYDLLTRVITTVGIISRILSDAVSVDDLITVTLNTLNIVNRSLSDSVDIYDLTNDQRIINLFAADGMDVSDATLRDVLARRNVFDNVTLTDYLYRTTLLTRKLDSSISLYDLLVKESVAYVIISRILTDNVDSIDTLTRILDIVRTLQGNIEVYEQTLQQALYERSIDDSVSIDDELLRQAITELLRILSDNVDTTDTQTRETLAIVLRELVSAVDVLDQTFRETGLIRLLTDSLGLSDDIIRAVITHLLYRTLSDRLEVDDEVIQVILRNARVVKIIYDLLQRDVGFELALRDILYRLDERDVDTDVKRI